MPSPTSNSPGTRRHAFYVPEAALLTAATMADYVLSGLPPYSVVTITLLLIWLAITWIRRPRPATLAQGAAILALTAGALLLPLADTAQTIPPSFERLVLWALPVITLCGAATHIHLTSSARDPDLPSKQQ